MEQFNLGLAMVYCGVNTSLYIATQEGNRNGLTVQQLIGKENAGLPVMLKDPIESLDGLSIEEAVKLSINKGVKERFFEVIESGGEKLVILTPAGENYHMKLDVDQEVSEVLGL